jgi:hypothetical protein
VARASTLDKVHSDARSNASQARQAATDAAKDSAEATAAYGRAIAWARSPKGTPYGRTTPAPEPVNPNPSPLDPKAMARLLKTEAQR